MGFSCPRVALVRQQQTVAYSPQLPQPVVSNCKLVNSMLTTRLRQDHEMVFSLLNAHTGVCAARHAGCECGGVQRVWLRSQVRADDRLPQLSQGTASTVWGTMRCKASAPDNTSRVHSGLCGWQGSECDVRVHRPSRSKLICTLLQLAAAH